MDPRDGHRECPSCLGRAHLLEDVENPCPAALELPLEERARRAGRQVEAQPVEGAPPTHSRRRAESPEGQALKQKQKHPHRSSKRRTPEDPRSRRDKSSDEDLQLKLLTAIRGLSEMLTNWEAPAGEASQTETGSSAPPRMERSRDASPDRRPSYQERGDVLLDEISLYARDSLVGKDPEESRSVISSDQANAMEDGEGTISSDLVSRVLSAAKIVGLKIPTDTPSAAEGVWTGISQPRPTTSIPATDDYCQMLRRAWAAPSRTPQYNARCRKLAKAAYPLETGLGDVPPVEKDMVALPSLCPTKVTTDPRTSCAEDQDIRDMVDAALSAHAQLTRDIGAAMASAIVTRRQIWLPQTSLPDGIKRELTNMPVETGRVFHGESQNVLERAECSLRARDSVNQTFRRPMFNNNNNNNSFYLYSAFQGPKDALQSSLQG